MSRRFHHKVRSGCSTCKIRRVKCDEARPACRRCTSTGRKCDGYPSPSPDDALPVNLSLITSAVPDLNTDDKRRAFDYYCTRSSTILAGTVDTSFWVSLVPRLSLAEPTVRHAVVALSALHEHVNSAEEASKQKKLHFGLQEYNEAVSLLRSRPPVGQDSAVPLLVVCLLFICIEFLLDDEATSQIHIGQGRQVLAQVASSIDPRSHAFQLIKNVLVPLYTRLSLASYTMGRNPTQIPSQFKMSGLSLPPSLDELRQSFFEIADEGFSLAVLARPIINATTPDHLQLQTLVSRRRRLLHELGQWHEAFTASTHLRDHSGQENFLMLLYHVMLVWISTALDPLETAYDAYLPSFRTATLLATSILQARNGRETTDSFVFETDLVPELYWIATKCRHASVRREALDLLLDKTLTTRRENLWVASESHVIAAKIVQLEEWHAARSQADPQGNFSPPLVLPEKASIVETVARIEKTAGPAPAPSGADEARREVLASSVLANGEDAPYGIPESCRVKLGVVGPRDKKGTWLTVYMQADGDASAWKTGKEYVRWIRS